MTRDSAPTRERIIAHHAETPVTSARELDELTRLRIELSYADWKAHPRYRTERVLREAQRQWGVPERETLFWSGLLPSSDAAADDGTADGSPLDGSAR